MQTFAAANIGNSPSQIQTNLMERVFNGEDFILAHPMPDRVSLAREVRFYLSYYQNNRVLQTSKWLGELLLTISSPTNFNTQGASLQDDGTFDV